MLQYELFKNKKIQIGLAQYIAAAVYRLHPSTISLNIGTFPHGCFYDFTNSKSSKKLVFSIEEILPTIINNETALRREMVAKNAANLFRAEKKIHLAKEAESLGNRIVYVFQLHSFFYLSKEDFSLDFSQLYFTVKECIPRGNLSKREIPVFRIISYTSLSKQELNKLLRVRRVTSTRMHHTLGESMDLFHFEYDQNRERIIWREAGSSMFFRLQQFWHRFLRMNSTLLIEPYPIYKEIKSYMSQIEKLPSSFSHKYLDYNKEALLSCTSPFPNLYSLPLQMKDCSYEFCSFRSLEKRLIIKQNLIESFYGLLKIPYYKKGIKSGVQYFYDSILGEPIALGYILTTSLAKDIAVIEYSLTHSIETIMGVLLENFGDKFPFWLHPIQISIRYESSQLPAIKQILLKRDITYHLEEIKKNNRKTIKDLKAFYNIFFLKNDEIRIRGEKNTEQKVTLFELDTLLEELEKKNCPEKLIIG